MSAYSLAHIKSNAIVPQLRQGAMDAVYNPLMLLKSPFLHSLHFVARERGGGEKQAILVDNLSLAWPFFCCQWLHCFWWVEEQSVYYLEICFKKRFLFNLSALQKWNKGGKKHRSDTGQPVLTIGNCMTEGCCKDYKWNCFFQQCCNFDHRTNGWEVRNTCTVYQIPSTLSGISGKCDNSKMRNRQWFVCSNGTLKYLIFHIQDYKTISGSCSINSV